MQPFKFISLFYSIPVIIYFEPESLFHDVYCSDENAGAKASCLTNVIFFMERSLFQVKTSPIILASISFLVVTFFPFQIDLRMCV